jgi:hypothetical protein
LGNWQSRGDDDKRARAQREEEEVRVLLLAEIDHLLARKRALAQPVSKKVGARRNGTEVRVRARLCRASLVPLKKQRRRRKALLRVVIRVRALLDSASLARLKKKRRRKALPRVVVPNQKSGGGGSGPRKSNKSAKKELHKRLLLSLLPRICGDSPRKRLR